MKELIAAVAGLGLLLFLMRNEKVTFNQYESFEVESEEQLLKNTIAQIQERDPNVYPIDTVYFQKDKAGYIGRFMFLNTDGFYGVQYDIETDGKQLTSMKKSVPPEYKSPFSGYVARQDYKDLTTTKQEDMKIDQNAIAENLRTENVAVGYYATDPSFKGAFMKTL